MHVDLQARQQSQQLLVPLRARQALRFTQARGLHLRGMRGQLWVTIDRDARDLVLGPGDEWVVDADEPLLVTALLGEGTLGLCQPAAAAAPSRGAAWPAGLLGRLGQRLQRWRQPAGQGLHPVVIV